MQAWHAIGYATITNVPQTQIDIFVPSHKRDVADLPLILPTGAVLYYLGLRTPAVALIGATGERLKVGTVQTDVNPGIAVASNAIAPNSFASAAATPFAAPLATMAVPTQYRLLNSNAGNTAAGTGIRVASGTQRVIVDACYVLPGEPSRVEMLGYLSTY